MRSVPDQDEDLRAESEDLARACHDINSALACVVSCLEYVGDRSTGEVRSAVDDAQMAARRIALIADVLRKRYGRGSAALPIVESGVIKAAAKASGGSRVA